jgi:hypothetical protein
MLFYVQIIIRQHLEHPELPNSLRNLVGKDM